MERNPGIVGPVLCAIAACLTSLYIAGYFCLCDRTIAIADVEKIRCYQSSFVSTAYWPLAEAESAITGVPVSTSSYCSRD